MARFCLQYIVFVIISIVAAVSAIEQSPLLSVEANAETGYFSMFRRQLRRFNIYKSYGSMPVAERPSQYGVGFKRFGTSEYLTQAQKRMYANRYGADQTKNMFDDKNPLPQHRQLRGSERI